MYITKLSPVLGDDYKVHQKVREIFPAGQKVLFQRCDEGVFVMSERKPVDDKLLYNEVDTSLYSNGYQHAFTLRLNPTKRDIKTKKRVSIEPLLTREWIKRKLDAIGIEANFQYIREGMRCSIRQGKTISLTSVLIFGVLTIKNSDIFQESFLNGIGHGKGFGFGFINLF